MKSRRQFAESLAATLSSRSVNFAPDGLGPQRFESGDSEADEYRPLGFTIAPGKQPYLLALCRVSGVEVQDTIADQLREWIKCSATDVSEVKSESAIAARVARELAATDGDTGAYGVWFYYPWRQTVVHVLPAQPYALVRSNRNRNKITYAEQQKVWRARIGVIGLSVGHAAAMVLAQEGLCGQLRVADFDVLELSNLNRLRTTVFNLGTKKTTIAARDLAEIDPYLEVRVFSEGVRLHNVDEFLAGPDGREPLDLLVEECDSLDVKLLARERARTHGIPVVMDTNDRGLLDVERFDREPNRPLLHGLMGDLDYERAQDLIKNGAPSARMAVFSAFFGGREQMSARFRESLDLLGTKLLGASQLASDVHLGAALVANSARRILLDELQGSGRYTIDLDVLIKD